ncbi:hypothetical protein X777_15583, partial [Ooceraea biroi]
GEGGFQSGCSALSVRHRTQSGGANADVNVRALGGKCFIGASFRFSFDKREFSRVPRARRVDNRFREDAAAVSVLSYLISSGKLTPENVEGDRNIQLANLLLIFLFISKKHALFTNVLALVLLLLTLLSMTKVEGWNATGLVSLTLITVVIIKLFGIAIAYSDLVDMSGDWSYLIEFGFGIILIVIILGTELLLVITHTLTATVTVAAAFGSFLSLVSLMDLHQNMSTNSWWWEERMLHGCLHHVFRQYTLSWCVRIEEKPRLITIFDGVPEEQRRDATTLNSE